MSAEPTTEPDALAGARVAWFMELLTHQDVQHLDGCTGQAECGACVIEDVKGVLAEPDRPIGGRHFQPASQQPGPTADTAALTEAVRVYLRLYLLPANVGSYLDPWDTHDRVAKRCAPLLVEHVLAPVEHRQVHRPTTGDSACTCGRWVGPMTTLAATDPRSFAEHVRQSTSLGAQPTESTSADGEVPLGDQIRRSDVPGYVLVEREYLGGVLAQLEALADSVLANVTKGATDA